MSDYQNRIWFSALVMSALCQKQPSVRLLDYLVAEAGLSANAAAKNAPTGVTCRGKLV